MQSIVEYRYVAVLLMGLMPWVALQAAIPAQPANEEDQRIIESILASERARAHQAVIGDDKDDNEDDETFDEDELEAAEDEDVWPNEGEEPARRYTTREERRDDGHRYEFGEWLSLAGIAEAEYERETLTNHEDRAKDTVNESPWSLELVAEITPLEWLKAELVYEYDSEVDDIKLDEAILAFETGAFELELGKLFVPFGEYFSHFVSGPSIEFAETSGRSAVLSYGPSDEFDLALFVVRGLARKEDRRGQEYDWGLALEVAPLEFATFGLSYLSDLADAEEMLLEDEDNRYSRKVDALSGYMLLGFDWIEFSAEFVHALDSFAELDPDRNEPLAWNTELAWFPNDVLGIALRFEGSKELEDEPRQRSGVALMWQVYTRVFLTVECLQGSFRRDFAEDSLEREARRIRQYAAQLSIEL